MNIDSYNKGSMPIHLEYTLTFEEYLQTLRLHARQRWRWRLNWIVAETVLPIFGVLIVGYALWHLLHDGRWILAQHSWIPWILLLIAGSAGTFLALYPLYMRRRIKRHYKLAASSFSDCTLEVDEAQIRAQRKNAKSEIEWGAINSYLENDKFFMLYLSPIQFFAIPKRVCTNDEINNLRSMFDAKIASAEGAPVTS